MRVASRDWYHQRAPTTEVVYGNREGVPLAPRADQDPVALPLGAGSHPHSASPGVTCVPEHHEIWKM